MVVEAEKPFIAHIFLKAPLLLFFTPLGTPC
jgi:hypothetical protein